MSSFALLLEEWDRAAAAAAHASEALGRQVDAFCAGAGPAPAREDIAQAQRLQAEAGHRLAAVQSLLLELRQQVTLI